MGIIFKKDETPTPGQMGISGTSGTNGGSGHTGGIKHNSDWDKTITPDTTKMLWGVINENTQLQQENYMLKNQLEEIRRLLIQ